MARNQLNQTARIYCFTVKTVLAKVQYTGLYTLFQSVFKDEDDKIRKYFDRTKPENLVKSLSKDSDESLIMVEFENDNHFNFTRQISLGTINTKMVMK